MTGIGGVISVEDLSLKIGGVAALTDVNLKVTAGEFTAVIGPNGAGKTSLYNCMTGVYSPTAGRVALNDTTISKLPIERIARMGVVRTFQNLALFRGLTVRENLLLGRSRFMRGGMIASIFQSSRTNAAQYEEVERIIGFLGLTKHRDRKVADLPYGVQKVVELGRALAQEPSVLLLDEPMAGMRAEEKQDMGRAILESKREFGMTVILIEHDMEVVMYLAERIVALNFGMVIGDGTPAQIRENPAVVEAYLGGPSSVATS